MALGCVFFFLFFFLAESGFIAFPWTWWVEMCQISPNRTDSRWHEELKGLKGVTNRDEDVKQGCNSVGLVWSVGCGSLWGLNFLHLDELTHSLCSAPKKEELRKLSEFQRTPCKRNTSSSTNCSTSDTGCSQFIRLSFCLFFPPPRQTNETVQQVQDDCRHFTRIMNYRCTRSRQRGPLWESP